MHTRPVKVDRSYSYPIRIASCVAGTATNTPIYLEYGGTSSNINLRSQTTSRVSGMIIQRDQIGKENISLQLTEVVGMNEMPAAAMAAMACAPDGRAWVFGGAEISREKNTVDWKPMAGFTAFQVRLRSTGVTSATAPPSVLEATSTALQPRGLSPPARHGHALLYVGPEDAGALGEMPNGALLLFGGTNSSRIDLRGAISTSSTMLFSDLWVFDVQRGTWKLLGEVGGQAPPPMLWPAAAVHKGQVGGAGT